MRIVKPYAKYLPTTGLSHNEHIARCARVCYASDKTTDNDQMVEGLIKKGHLSMLRHTTYYFKINKFVFDGHFPNKLKESPYCRYVYDEFYDCYICPNNETLEYATTNKNGYKEYKSDSSKCANCPFLGKCIHPGDPSHSGSGPCRIPFPAQSPLLQAAF